MPTDSETRHALVVEDEEQIAYLLRFILSREGFVVEVANDGRVAQELIATMPPPSLVLLDVMLPFVDGNRLLSEIRAREDWNAVPVIMLTAKSQEKDIMRALDAGASDYMVKPFKPEDLRARVRQVVKGAVS